MSEAKTAAIDIDGTEAVSRVLVTLLNEFPGLGDRRILFSTLESTSGLGFFPASGAALLQDREDVTGHVTQVCLYPFKVIYRAAPASEERRLRMKEFLDALGRWLEGQRVTVDGTQYQLAAYPALSSGNRVIKTIRRTSPGYLSAAYQDGVEDWVISATLRYENEFDR